MKEPNQPLEPTSTAGAPRADARVAPAVPVAHLERSAMKTDSARLTALILVVSLFTLVGCASITHISGDPRFQTDYRDGSVYVTTRELIGLAYRDSLLGNSRSVRVVAREVSPRLPGESLVTISAGTKVRVLHVVYDDNWELGTKVVIIAKVVSGPFARASANLDGISFHDKNPLVAWGLQRRNPAILREEKEMNQEPNQMPEPTAASGRGSS